MTGPDDHQCTVPVVFSELRVRTWPQEAKVDPDAWRMRERMKTVSVAIVLCLNVGVDPPDVYKPMPCARLECWIDPQNISQQKAIEIIGSALQKQYERWQPRARYKLSFDPTVEEIRKMCISLRKNAKDERVLFHYNGHGVPKPTENGEIWVFNKMYTQYIPLSLFDLQSWMGTPGIYIWDCNSAGMALLGFNNCAKQHEKEFLDVKKQRAARRSTSIDQQQQQRSVKKEVDALLRTATVDPSSPTSVSSRRSSYSVCGSTKPAPSLQQQCSSVADPAAADKDSMSDSLEAFADDPEMPKFRHCIQLAACSVDEVLPTHPELPADLFTSCLTMPVRTSILWYVLNNRLTKNLPLSLVYKIPGQLNDRRTPLGELNWIFTAVTDTIAWSSLPAELFQRLFRQDLLVASLFRNFLLAERIMRSYKCTPVSSPRLPCTHDHVMWDAWDHTLDVCLSQLYDQDDDDGGGEEPEETTPVQTLGQQARHRQRAASTRAPSCSLSQSYVHSDFFCNQLTAFEVWLGYGFHSQTAPQQLPIVLQVLLSQVHRLRALELLGRFLDLGPWAVNLALAVGIFPYVLRLLQSLAKELRPSLTFIWAKVLAVDSSCQVELVVHDAPVYFVQYLQDATGNQKVLAAFVLASLVRDYADGQRALMSVRYVTICAELLSSDCANALCRQWLVLGLGCLWTDCDEAKWQAVRCNLHDKLFELLADPVPAVRASVAYALGCFMQHHHRPGAAFNEQSTHLWHTIAMTLMRALTDDGSAVVRREVLAALYWFVVKFQSQFVTIAYELMDERRHSCAVDYCLPPPPAADLAAGRCESLASLGDLASLVDQIRRESSFSSFSNARTPAAPVDAAHEPSTISTSASPESPSSSMANAASLLINPRASMARLFGLIKHTDMNSMPDMKSKMDAPVVTVLDRKQQQQSTRDLGAVSNVYVTVWRTVHKYSLDADYNVASMASRLLAHITDQVLNLRRPSVPLGTGHWAPPSRRSTICDDSPGPKAKFIIGAASPPDTAGSDAVDSCFLAAGVCRLEIDPTPTYSAAYSTIYTSPRRPVFGQGPGDHHHHPAAAAAAVSADDNDEHRTRAPLIDTGFLNSCIESFKLPVISLLDDEDRPYPCHRRPLSSQRNDELRAAEEQLAEQWTALNGRQQTYSTLFTCRDSAGVRCVRFFPANPLVCLASACGAVTVWSWDSGSIVTKFDNAMCDHEASVQTIGQTIHLDLVNALTDGFLLTGTDQGVVRLWDGHLLADDLSMDACRLEQPGAARPSLLAAWSCADYVQRRHCRYPVTAYCWEQDAGLLFVGGDFRHLVVWNGHREQKEADLALGIGQQDVHVTSISSDTNGQHLTAAGCSDGTVRLFDRRLPTVEARIMTLRDLDAAVAKVHVQRACYGSRLVAVSHRAQLCVWDPRLFQEPVVLCQPMAADVLPAGSVDVHCQLPLLAMAPNNANQLNVFGMTGGRALCTVRHYESPLIGGQKQGGAICALAFHPTQVNFGVADSDSLFTMYSLTV